MSAFRISRAIASAVVALSVTPMLGGTCLAQDIIKVGAPLPLTGPLSPEGLKQKRGYDLWAEAANAKGIKASGKTYKVEIVYADYASNTPRAVQTAERMITEDKVQFLFAPFGSGATKAASAISEKYQIPMLAPSASSQEIFDQKFKYIFSTLTGNETVSVPIAKLVAKNKAIKRVAVLARNDLFPLAVAQEFEKAVKAEGMEVVTSERYAIGAMDHSAAITKMRAANPDWVYASGYINDLVLIRKQMNDLGLKAQVITEIAGPAYAEFAKTVGPLAENVTSMSWWHPAVRYKGPDVFGSTEAFNAAYAKANSGNEADYIEAGSAACGAILQMAIEKAGTVDPVKVRDAIAATDTETFYGRVKFAEGGQINSLQPPVFQLVGGKPVILWPDAIKAGEIRFMPK